ncbi:MAG: DNA-processing protein DprA [Acidimicrobiales bacterium]
MSARAPMGAPEEAYAAALAALPELVPAYLSRLLDIDGGGVPSEAWHRVMTGKLEPRRELSADRVETWRRAVQSQDPREHLARCRSLGLSVLVRGLPGYPARLAHDPAPPAVLFACGDLSVINQSRPTAVLVGTRRCSGYGRQMAQVLGRHLSERGVVVVSGMAAGIDAAAQSGALGREGPVVGVAATGLDVVYPASSAKLWERLGSEGLLLSEKAPGHGALPKSFVYRNRIMAGLADVVVVVESHIQGGALVTVDEAIRRGRTVMAVPGPVTSAASAGANALIADGCPPARDALDVQVALGLVRASRRRAGELVDVAPPAPRRRRGGWPTRPRPATAANPSRRGAGRAVKLELSELELELLDQVDATPTRMDVLMARTGLAPGQLALGLDALDRAGLVEAGPGWWARIAG